jgi:4-hydroxybenzoate polyprenyltransferase
MSSENTLQQLEARTPAALWRALASVRYREVLALQGPPLMGVAFTLGMPSAASLGLLAAWQVAALLLMCHVFCFNDWANSAADARDPNKSAGLFLNQGVTRREMALLAAGSLVGALALFGLFPSLLPIAAGIALLSFSYSGIHAKGVPVVSSIVHLTGGVLHFLLGFALEGGVGARGVLLGLLFALVFVAGHLTQEVRDYEGDRANGIRTNAVAFGERRMFGLAFAVFSAYYAYLLLLAAVGVMPAALAGLVVFYPAHVHLFRRTRARGLTFENVSRYQEAYRILFALQGLAIAAAALVR